MCPAFRGRADETRLSPSPAATPPSRGGASDRLHGHVDDLLHLSTTGMAPAAPDQLVAVLVAQATSSFAATALRRVNCLTADGLRTARDVLGMDARGRLCGAPGDERRTALLDLVGRLQGQGLVTASLEWQPSPALRQRAHDEAITAALRALQGRAAALGLYVDHLREMRLDGPVLAPRPLGGMVAMAARAVPPQATATPVEVTVEVSTDVVLRP